MGYPEQTGLLENGKTEELSGLSDNELVRRYGEDKDEGCFAMLWQRHKARVTNVVRQHLKHDRGQVEDIVQDVAVLLVRYLGTFRGESEFKTWLHRIAMNAAMQHTKTHGPKRQRTKPLADSMEPDAVASGAVPAPDDELIRHETMQAIIDALDQLPPDQALVVVLSDIERMSGPEIAAYLGEVWETIKSRLRRARLKLREMLGPLYDPAAE